MIGNIINHMDPIDATLVNFRKGHTTKEHCKIWIQFPSNKKIDRKKKENLRINNRMLYESAWINNRSFQKG